jgi:hypothetical protein
MNQNLRHVSEEICEDPDCEIHHIEVGLAEGTVSDTNLAFYIAGAQAMEMAIRKHFPALSENRKLVLKACLEGGRPILNLAEGR